jgi:hypothetical protein
VSLSDLMSKAKQVARQVRSAGVDVTQRWRARRDFYRSTHEDFEPSHWRVELLDGPGAKDRARDFVVANHYAGTYPQTRLQVGLFRARDGLFSGVASFGNGPRGAGDKYGGVGHREIVELNRFVLLDEVPGNAETWFLSGAMGLAGEVLSDRGDQLKVVLSYSDPVPRRSLSGFLTMPGHIGNIYQAHNAIYVGRSRSKPLYLDRRGIAPDLRMISKIRSLDGERPERGGHAGARRFVEEFGAPERRRGESYTDWIERSLGSPAFRKLPHAGNLTYLWPIGSKSLKRQLRASFPEALPYPKTPRQLYLNLTRRYERAWSQGDLEQVAILADRLLDVWVTLTPDDRPGLPDPPQVGASCEVGRGHANRQALTLDQVMQRVVC